MALNKLKISELKNRLYTSDKLSKESRLRLNSPSLLSRIKYAELTSVYVLLMKTINNATILFTVYGLSRSPALYIGTFLFISFNPSVTLLYCNCW